MSRLWAIVDATPGVGLALIAASLLALLALELWERREW